MMFATFRGRLTHDVPMIARQRNTQTRHDDLEALIHAGFVDVCSRETLESRLDELYSRSRAEKEKEKEKELDLEQTPLPQPSTYTPEGAGIENGQHQLPDLNRVLKDMPL
jgi:DNA polymerase III alpha subunit